MLACSYYIAASRFLYVMMQRIPDKYVSHKFIVSCWLLLLYFWYLQSCIS